MVVRKIVNIQSVIRKFILLILLVSLKYYLHHGSFHKSSVSITLLLLSYGLPYKLMPIS